MSTVAIASHHKGHNAHQIVSIARNSRQGSSRVSIASTLPALRGPTCTERGSNDRGRSIHLLALAVAHSNQVHLVQVLRDTATISGQTETRSSDRHIGQIRPIRGSQGDNCDIRSSSRGHWQTQKCNVIVQGSGIVVSVVETQIGVLAVRHVVAIGAAEMDEGVVRVGDAVSGCQHPNIPNQRSATG